MRLIMTAPGIVKSFTRNLIELTLTISRADSHANQRMKLKVSPVPPPTHTHKKHHLGLWERKPSQIARMGLKVTRRNSRL
eukprot:691653-Amphidinium_carterae.1